MRRVRACILERDRERERERRECEREEKHRTCTSVCLCDRKRIKVGEGGHRAGLKGKQCAKVEIVYRVSSDKSLKASINRRPAHKTRSDNAKKENKKKIDLRPLIVTRSIYSQTYGFFYTGRNSR